MIPSAHIRFTSNLRRHLPSLLLLAGVCLLGYVGIEYFSMYNAQKQMAAEWSRQNAAPTLVHSAQFRNYGITRMEIPKINLDAFVVEGSSRKQLKIAPGHIPTSAAPGDDGNSVITAHRDTFFRHIYELSKGDTILVRRNGELLKFEVVSKKIVQPDDLSVLAPTPDAHLTLITCYPTYYIGPAPERLVVVSKLVERTSENNSAVAVRPN